VGTIEPYEAAGGRRYRVRYRKPDHSQTDKRGFRTKREAELFLATVESRKAAGTYLDPSTARITVGELGREWLANQTHLKPSSVAAVESAWRLHVLPAWGDVPIGQVRYSAVQSWVSSLVKGSATGRPKSAALVLRAHGALAAILDVAVRDHRIGANPARGVALPRKVPREHRHLTHEQVHLLAAACGPHETLVKVLAYTGLRWGEVTGLRVRDVSAQRGRLTIAQNAVLVRGEVIVGTPKTHKRRSVPFPAFLSAEIAEAVRGKGSDDLVFPATDGRHLITPTVRDRSWFDRALEVAGLPPMTIHDLRHTAASLAVSAGANVKAVQKMLGHASAAMTLDVYTDLFDDDLDAVAARLDQAVAAASVGKMWAKAPPERPRQRPERAKKPGIPGQ
jgi:integrase